MSSMRLMFFGVWLTYQTGCSYVADLSLVAKSRRSAECAWKQEHGFYRESGMPYTIRQHFGSGFVKGYEDVANGSNGTPPLFPPQCYWGSAYQSPAGDEKVRAWFNGYQEGATAALRDGRAGTNELPTSWAPPGRVPHAVQIIPGEVIPPGTSEQAIIEPPPAPTLRRPKSELDEVEPLPATTKDDLKVPPKETPKQELLEIPQKTPQAPTSPAPLKTPSKTPSQTPSQGNSEVREPTKTTPPKAAASFWRRAFMPETVSVAPVPPNQLAGYETSAAESLKSDPKAIEEPRSEVVQSQYFGVGFTSDGVGRSAEENVALPSFDSPIIIPRRSMNDASKIGSSAPSSGDVRSSAAAPPVVELRDLFGPPNLNDFIPAPRTSPSDEKPSVAPALRELFPGPDLGR